MTGPMFHHETSSPRHVVTTGSTSAFLVASCALVATAYVLGVDWLRSAILGLPSGIWLIAGVMAVRWGLSRRRIGRTSEAGLELWQEKAVRTDADRQLTLAFSDVGDRPDSGNETLGSITWDAPTFARNGTGQVALLETARLVARSFEAATDRVGFRPSLPQFITSAHDRIAWPTAPLRIGVSLPSRFLDAVAGASSPFPVEWIPLRAEEPDERAFVRHQLDAIVRLDDLSHLYISTNERPGRDAAWYDWSAAAPLTYASVFPLRIDPGQLSLGTMRAIRAVEAALLRALIDASAILARSEPRLGLADRLAGRRPFAFNERPTLADHAMLVLSQRAASSSDSQLHRSAARAVSAWLATTEASVPVEARREGIEVAWRAIPGEPHLALRAVAARVAAYQDAEAMHAARVAADLIDPEATTLGPEPWAFIQSELEHSTPGDMTLGRIAAGVCLICATTPVKDRGFLLGDLADDLRHTGWLIGREDDQRLLMELMRTVAPAVSRAA